VPQLLDQALTESSPDKRRELYGEAQQIIMEEAASCPMTFQATAIAYSKKLQGFTPPSVGNLTSIYKVRPA
jgi:ABC-type transport system substrate-binding protein